MKNSERFFTNFLKDINSSRPSNTPEVEAELHEGDYILIPFVKDSALGYQSGIALRYRDFKKVSSSNENQSFI
ncbi:MAG: hypothetical protein ACFFDN_41410, partial [Candidatus Hodarchaeota archaeon]